jgi:VWFA-related protein
MKLPFKWVLAVLFFHCFALFSLISASTQNQEKTQELRHEVAVTLKLIQVYVTDKKGNPVLDLGKEDFVIYDNGKEKSITEFEKHILAVPSIEEKRQPEIVRETTLPAPRELMGRKFFLLFDFAYNNPRGILKAKKAALHFIDTQLQPSDEVGLLSYSAIKSLTLHEYLTTDYGKVREVAESFGLKNMQGRAEHFEEDIWLQGSGVNPPDASKSGGVSSVRMDEELETNIPSFSPEMQRHIKRLDSNVHALHFVQKMEDFAKALRYIPGYKHIILFSSGIPYSLMYGIHYTPRGSRQLWDTGNKLLQLEYDDMLKELAASNSTVYTLDTEDMGTMIAVNSRVRGGYTLQTMASSTGGKYFGDINSFEEHLEKIQGLTACYYVIGYYVDEKWDGKYHKLKVRVDRPGCEVHAQKGYFNPKLFSRFSKLEKMLHLVDLALSEKHVFQTPVRFPLKALPCVVKENTNVALYLKIKMENIQGLSGKDVEIVSIVFDNQDDIIKIEGERVDLSKLPEGNIYYSSLLSLDPGEYKCRIVLRNLETGRGAVASSSVEIPKSPDSGIQLYPPLLLKQEKKAFYLKEPSVAHSFDTRQYSPLVEEMEQGTDRILAVARCSFTDIKAPNVQLAASLVHRLTGTEREIFSTFKILDEKRMAGASEFFVELRTQKLVPGEYSFELFAFESQTGARSRVSTAFKVK